MEEIFKQNLLNLRQAASPMTFGEALFPNAFWRPKSTIQVAKTLKTEEFSEKKQVLESFERFAQDKLEQSPVRIMNLDGGEIGLKPVPSWEGIPSFQGLQDLKSSLKVVPEALQLLFHNKVPGRVKAIFVTESFRAWEESSQELKQGFINELIVGFPLKTAELFERMILAMKLQPEEVILYPVESEGQDLSSEVMAIAAFFKPEVIITLGAKATQKILKTNDRLTLVHGQFFPRTVDGNETFQVVPLFHPSIIETNQNMKKTAWADMQKIMKHLKKLP